MGLVLTLEPEIRRGRWSVSIDHNNGDKLDNRRANLRVLDRSAQMLNLADRLRSTNTSGYRGVNYCAKRRARHKWRAYAGGRTIGWYATVEDAVAARQRWDERQE